jgi:hypothetical protein
MAEHHRVRRLLPLNERLAVEAIHLREQAKTLPPGPKRDDLLKEARRLEITTQLDKWLSSPGLKSPR